MGLQMTGAHTNSLLSYVLFTFNLRETKEILKPVLQQSVVAVKDRKCVF